MPEKDQSPIGQKFGLWTVLGITRAVRNGEEYWHARCDCGNEKTVYAYFVRKGRSKSCGCDRGRLIWVKRGTGRLIEPLPTKNHYRTYMVWSSMLQRCENPKAQAFRLYGARGIRVCDEWHVFDNFLRDMGEKPGRLSLDRIDNDSGYSKDNCRWATYKEQNRNRRGNVLFTLNGKTQIQKDWCAEYNISEQALFHRLKSGLPFYKALLFSKKDLHALYLANQETV